MWLCELIYEHIVFSPKCYKLKVLIEGKVKVAHTRLLSVGFRSWSRFLAVGLQVMWVINPAVGCHYFPPGPQLPSQPLRGLLPVLLLSEQKHNGCEQFAYDCYPTLSRLRFEPRPSAPESSTLSTRPPSSGRLIGIVAALSYLVWPWR